MRQVSKWNNEVEEAETKGLGLAMRGSMGSSCLLVEGHSRSAEEGGKHGTGTE